MVTMKTASVGELKAHLGRYLGFVREGETVVVTSHRHPVARLTGAIPVRDSVTMLPPERPVTDLESIGPVRLSKAVDGVAELLEDRQRR